VATLGRAGFPDVLLSRPRDSGLELLTRPPS